MESLLIVGGSLAFVLLVVWGARKWWFSGSNSFYLDELIYTRHPDGHYTLFKGARIADPALIARLDEEWRIVTSAYALQQRGYGGILPRNFDPANPPAALRHPSRTVFDEVNAALDMITPIR